MRSGHPSRKSPLIWAIASANCGIGNRSSCYRCRLTAWADGTGQAFCALAMPPMRCPPREEWASTWRFRTPLRRPICLPVRCGKDGSQRDSWRAIERSPKICHCLRLTPALASECSQGIRIRLSAPRPTPCSLAIQARGECPGDPASRGTSGRDGHSPGAYPGRETPVNFRAKVAEAFRCLCRHRCCGCGQCGANAEEPSPAYCGILCSGFGRTLACAARPRVEAHRLMVNASAESMSVRLIPIERNRDRCAGPRSHRVIRNRRGSVIVAKIIDEYLAAALGFAHCVDVFVRRGAGHFLRDRSGEGLHSGPLIPLTAKGTNDMQATYLDAFHAPIRDRSFSSGSEDPARLVSLL